MEPTLRDGDLVLIRQQPEVEPGQIAAVNINNETTLKHVYPQENGILLVADNPQYQPVFVPVGAGDEILIHGLAVGYTRLFS
jgi:repressor LexA